MIFILADDLGFGDVGVFHQNQRRDLADRSKPWHQTPNLDRAASEGIALTHHYCAAPVCAPSRASLLSGLHQGHANVRNNQFDKALEENHNLATVLKHAGYETYCIGKWGLAGPSPEFPAHPLRRGFDHFYGVLSHVEGHDHYPKESPHRGPVMIREDHRIVIDALDKCYTTDLFTARAKHSIIEHQKSSPEKPFFMYLAYDTPHAILQLPTSAYPQDGGLQWLGKPGRMINTADGEIDSWVHPDYAHQTWDHDSDVKTAEQPWPDVFKRYATSVRRIDDCVGDLIQLLKDRGIDDNTLIVFTSDNGPSTESYLPEKYTPVFFGSYGPFSGHKRDVLEGGLRVGAIVRWPGGISAGRTSSLASGHWDWLPTFAEMTGCPVPARSDGKSLIPTLRGSGKQQTPTIYCEYEVAGKTSNIHDFAPSWRGAERGQMQMMRIGDLSGIRVGMINGDEAFSHFNLAKDPRQAVNLSPDHADLNRLWQTEVLRCRRPLNDAPRPYDHLPIPSVSIEKPEHGILIKSRYPGEWPWLPDRTGLACDSTARVRTLDDEFTSPSLLSYDGFFHAPTTGVYRFFLKSSHASQLRIHHALVIDNDFHHSDSWTEAAIPLEAGYHPLRLDAFQITGELHLECDGPGVNRAPVIGGDRCAVAN